MVFGGRLRVTEHVFGLDERHEERIRAKKGFHASSESERNISLTNEVRETVLSLFGLPMRESLEVGERKKEKVYLIRFHRQAEMEYSTPSSGISVSVLPAHICLESDKCLT